MKTRSGKMAIEHSLKLARAELDRWEQTRQRHLEALSEADAKILETKTQISELRSELSS